MSDLTDRLRAIASKATGNGWTWFHLPGVSTFSVDAEPYGDDLDASDPVADVLISDDAEHIATFDPVLVAAMLDVIDAAEYRLSKDDTCWCPDPVDDETVCGSCREKDALARLREVAG